MFRFVNNWIVKKTTNHKKRILRSGPLTPSELDEALLLHVKMVQRQQFLRITSAKIHELPSDTPLLHLNP
jgi:hypothetical protein